MITAMIDGTPNTKLPTMLAALVTPISTDSACSA